MIRLVYFYFLFLFNSVWATRMMTACFVHSQSPPRVGEHRHGQPRRDGETAAGADGSGGRDDRSRRQLDPGGQRQVPQLARRGDAVVRTTSTRAKSAKSEIDSKTDSKTDSFPKRPRRAKT